MHALAGTLVLLQTSAGAPISRQDIRAALPATFERDPVLRDIIQAEYRERQSTLPFRLE